LLLTAVAGDMGFAALGFAVRLALVEVDIGFPF
jgi:hypothetical protein